MPGTETRSSDPAQPTRRWRFSWGEVGAAIDLAALATTVPQLLVVAGIVAFWLLGGAVVVVALALMQLPLYWAALALRPVADESRAI